MSTKAMGHPTEIPGLLRATYYCEKRLVRFTLIMAICSVALAIIGIGIIENGRFISSLCHGKYVPIQALILNSKTVYPIAYKALIAMTMLTGVSAVTLVVTIVAKLFFSLCYRRHLDWSNWTLSVIFAHPEKVENKTKMV